MSLRIRNGKYVVDHYPQGAKGPRPRITLPLGTPFEQAKRIHDGIVKRKKGPLLAAGETPIKYLIPAYLLYVKDHQEERTLHDKEHIFEKQLTPYFGGYAIPNLSNALIAAYQSYRSAQFSAMTEEEKKKHGIKTGNRSINKELAYLGGLVKWARKYRKIRPLEPIEREDMPYKRPIPKILTKDELARLIDKADDPIYKALILALFRLGQRITATQCLTWEQVDLQQTAQDSSVIFKGKGSKENPLPLMEDIFLVLRSLKDERDKKPEANRSKYVFPSRKKGLRPIADADKALARAKKAANIDKRIHAHLIRHSMATHMLDDGVDIRVIQMILGHSKVTTTEWYTQVSLALKRQAFERSYKKK